ASKTADVIGQSPRRREDERLVTGRGRFIDDVAPPGCLHVAIVRSTHARARIVSVDVTAARALPGVPVFVAGDLPQLGTAPPAPLADADNPRAKRRPPPPPPAVGGGGGRLGGGAWGRGGGSERIQRRRRGGGRAGGVRAVAGRGRRRGRDDRRCARRSPGAA